MVRGTLTPDPLPVYRERELSSIPSHLQRDFWEIDFGLIEVVEVVGEESLDDGADDFG